MPASLAQSMGVVPAYIAVGAAAGVHRYIKEAEMPQSTASARAVLQDVACLSPDDPITALILDYYEMICSGSTVAQLCAKAEQIKHAGLGDVV
ncbi:MAG: hypothetical protein IJT78_00585 [Oscillospiraceae bacterium]|nr:hypothetical protein [Oscillospiraceae bacterium]